MHRYPAIPPHTAQVIPLKIIICITVSGAILNKNTIIDDNIIVNILQTLLIGITKQNQSHTTKERLINIEKSKSNFNTINI